MPQSLTEPKIEIFLKSKRLRLLSGNQLIKEYPVAIGKPNTPTPVGNFEIRAKVMYPGGVYGTRWMEFKPEYGIHGTNNPASIGTMASLGCVRMHNHDVDELFGKVRMGTPVIIKNSIADGGQTPSSGGPYSPPAGGSTEGGGNNGQKTYVVKKGDTLWLIAQRFNVTVSQIVAINNIPNPNRLNVGQILTLP
ncbi:MAG: L,D-transpeptidase family protein [Bacillota bacterium]|nr:L,D-transpeptidase family protein [Bacillota bacterium]